MCSRYAARYSDGASGVHGDTFTPGVAVAELTVSRLKLHPATEEYFDLISGHGTHGGEFR